MEHTNGETEETKIEHINSEGYIDGGKKIIVNVDKIANVYLMDDENYSAYKKGENFKAIGEKGVKQPEVVIEVPHSDNWHVVIDLGGGTGELKYNVKVI